MSDFSREAGISTRVCLAVTALRIRLSLSAIGSVISFSTTHLPAAFCHSRDVALERRLPEAQTAQCKLPHVGARASAELTTVAQPNLELRLLMFLGDLCGRGHFVFPWRTA